MSESRLSHFPIPFFGSAMGLSGLSIALLRYAHMMNLPWLFTIGKVFLYGVTGWFSLLLVLYFLKLLKYPAQVREEWNHPVRMNFFAAISISLLLLAIGYLDIAPAFSQALWCAGTLLHLVFLIRVFRVWIIREFAITMINPAWFIPVVGTILVPIAGVTHADSEVSWFFFSIGIVYWIVLMTIVLYRIIFHNPVPERLLPTLFILIAPPAVGFVAYIKLTGGGELDVFARILYYQAAFITTLLFTLFNTFRKVPFSLAWWAYTFPLAAMTIATMLYAHHVPHLLFYKIMASVMMAITVAVIGVVTLMTVRAAQSHKICVPE